MFFILLISFCDKNTEPESLFSVTLNYQNNNWNCVQLVFTRGIWHEYLNCGQGIHDIGDSFEEDTYQWIVTLYDNYPVYGTRFQEGEIYLNRNMECRITDDTVYWE